MFIPLLTTFLTLVSAAPQVKLGNTVLIGSHFAASNVDFFGGIPFAQPPLGKLRFEPPVLTTSLEGATFDAGNFGLACLQTVSSFEIVSSPKSYPLTQALPPELVSEDCLNLNVFRPAGLPAKSALPVMVWIYGGGFVMGASSLYNGTEIVARSVARGTPVIFASMNYRVGPLGFPQGVESGLRNATNLGLKDQLAALRWIQANIGKFGGDKTKVTIFGESAGASSVDILLLSKDTTHVARAAILESDPVSPTFGPEHGEASWQNFVAAVPECAPLATSPNTFPCLQGASSASLLQALITASISGNTTLFSPVIDGPGGLLPDVPSRVTPRARLPVMIGTNLDEGALFVPQTLNSTEEIRLTLLGASTPSFRGADALATAVEEVLVLYPDDPAQGSPFGTGNNTFGLSSQYKRAAAIFGDFIFQSPRRAFTQSMSQAGVKVFSYHFTDPDAVIPPGLTPVPPAPGSLGVTHSSEIFYVFNTLANPTPTAISLSGIMQDYWISFAVNLDPNDGRGHRRPNWPQYTPNNQVVMQLNGHNTTVIPDTFRAEQIAFINADPLVFHR